MHPSVSRQTPGQFLRHPQRLRHEFPQLGKLVNRHTKDDHGDFPPNSPRYRDVLNYPPRFLATSNHRRIAPCRVLNFRA